MGWQKMEILGAMDLEKNIWKQKCFDSAIGNFCSNYKDVDTIFRNYGRQEVLVNAIWISLIKLYPKKEMRHDSFEKHLQSVFSILADPKKIEDFVPGFDDLFLKKVECHKEEAKKIKKKEKKEVYIHKHKPSFEKLNYQLNLYAQCGHTQRKIIEDFLGSDFKEPIKIPQKIPLAKNLKKFFYVQENEIHGIQDHKIQQIKELYPVLQKTGLSDFVPHKNSEMVTNEFTQKINNFTYFKAVLQLFVQKFGFRFSPQDIFRVANTFFDTEYTYEYLRKLNKKMLNTYLQKDPKKLELSKIQGFDKKPFLKQVFDFETQNQRQALIFYCEEKLKVFSKKNKVVFFIDGTRKYFSKDRQRQQMVAISIKNLGKVYTLIYIICRQESKVGYYKIFKEIQEKTKIFNHCKYAVIDQEMAFYHALKQLNIKTLFCYFHLRSIFNKRRQKINPKIPNQDFISMDCLYILGKIFFLRDQDKDKYLNLFYYIFKKDSYVFLIYDYFMKRYYHRFEIFSIGSCKETTNNVAESLNSQISSRFSRFISQTEAVAVLADIDEIQWINQQQLKNKNWKDNTPRGLQGFEINVKSLFLKAIDDLEVKKEEFKDKWFSKKFQLTFVEDYKNWRENISEILEHSKKIDHHNWEKEIQKNCFENDTEQLKKINDQDLEKKKKERIFWQKYFQKRGKYQEISDEYQHENSDKEEIEFINERLFLDAEICSKQTEDTVNKQFSKIYKINYSQFHRLFIPPLVDEF